MVELEHVNFVYESESSELLASLDSRGTGRPETMRDEGLSAALGEASDADGRLHDVNFRVEDGQFVLITGPSGCGKSTVLRLINGLIPHFYTGKLEGKVLVCGKDVTRQELYETGQTVGTVFQNPRSQFFNADTDSELAFACENRGMDPDVIRERMADTIDRFQVDDLMGRSIFRLSGGEKQKIACASIDVGGPQVILLDEPSANLDYEATMRLRDLIAQWKGQGCTIIVAEHRISYLWDLIDRAVIMSAGTIVADLDTPEKRNLSPDELAEMGLRSTVPESPLDVDIPSVDEAEDAYVLRDFRFSYRTGLFARKKERERKTDEPTIDFDGVRIAAGKITAVVGANGSGKTTLLHCLCGLERRCKGAVDRGGQHYGRRELASRAFLVMQDTNHQLFTESALDELLITMTSEGGESDERAAHAILAQVDLDRFADRHPMSLSGGQKQRLAVACALASGRDILLFDEPTSGLDHAHMMQTAELIQSLRDMGKTVVVVTHDSEFIHSCCDRKLSVRKGRSA